MAAKKEGIYRNIKWESEEELYFLMWAFELLDKGIIRSIDRAESFSLSDKLTMTYSEIKELKTKVKSVDKEFLLLREHIYTPEFKIVWDSNKSFPFLNPMWDNKKPIKSLFYNFTNVNNPITYIEVKSDYDGNNMTRLFKINQKWIYEKYQIYINLIIPKNLFNSTFTPDAYRLTPTGKKKVINYKNILTLQEFLNK